MAILTDPPEWEVPGTKPPQNIIKDVGWEVGSRPPAPWWNWFFYTVAKSLRELETATLARIINEAGVPGIMAGPESERPTASPETVGRIYIATDTKRMYRDQGTGWDLLNTPESIGAETPSGAQQKADAAAASALSSALAYTDSAVAAHANRTDNPHGVTKAQVGLGSVENYPVASQAEAEAGTANNRYMTPLRTRQAIEVYGTIPRGVIVMWSGSIDQIPQGWALCDGTNGTPDLRDRFIVGAGLSYQVGERGGAAQVTLTVNHLPPHSHTIPIGSRGDRTHAGGEAEYGWHEGTTVTSVVGGGQPHENRPPYYALCFIMKL